MGKLLQSLSPIFTDVFPTDYYVVYSKMLQLFIDANAHKGGRIVHTHLITNGFALHLHLSTKLIIFYGKLGDMVAARNVFSKMPDRSVVSWTALLSGYSQNGHFLEALMVFLTMRRVGVSANQFTYGSGLRACIGMGCLERGKQIQGCIQKGRFVENLFVQSALVDLHSKCGKMEDACYIFDMMFEKDLVSWNVMIGGYAAQGCSDGSFRMFRLMLRGGGIPDGFTLGSVLKASASGHSLIKVRQTHGFVIHLGFESHNALTGSLIDAYAKCESISSAYHLFKHMSQKDIISCTALIAGYSREGCCNRDALNLFSEIHWMCLVMDDVLLCSMLNICASIASLRLGRQIHTLAFKYQLSYDVAMGNALIDMYAKSGGIEDAKCAFDEMEEKNVISWTSLISGYGKHGYGQKAIALFKNMEHDGLKPNDVTFLSLLFACSHTGLIDEGWDCFNTMVCKYNISPRAEHYSCMVDLLARAGQLEEAYNIMSKFNIGPNVSLWGAILGACATYGNMTLGEMAARHLFNMNPESSVNYITLSSLYAAAGLWDNACNMRKLMEHKCLKKDPGYSLLQPTKNIAFLQIS